MSSNSLDLGVGLDTWTLTDRPETAVQLHRKSTPTRNGISPGELLRNALEKPFGFNSPLRSAVTSEDRIAIVLDEQLPHIGELLAVIIAHLGSAGIQPAAITVVVPPNGSGNTWIDDLPDEYADIRLEIHDTEDRNKLAYLATTTDERRVYLNRTIVDADFVLVLSGRRFDPTLGYSGAEATMFPVLSDAETLASFVGKFTKKPPGTKTHDIREAAAEVTWMLGMPFFVQVISGLGDTIQEIITGLPPSTSEGIVRHEAYWRSTIDIQPDLVIAAISGDPKKTTFLHFAQAIAAASRVVQPGGRIAVLSTATPRLEEGAELIRQIDEPDNVPAILKKRKPDDWPAAALWTMAAKKAHLFLASGFTDDVAEELFATPVHSVAEVQRLLDAAEHPLILPDAHKIMVEVAEA